MEKKDADKIREIIKPENISKLSINELNKYVNQVNSIFPESASEQFGSSEIVSIRQILSTTLQIHIFKNAKICTVIALIISILALLLSAFNLFHTYTKQVEPIPVYLIQPPPINEEKPEIKSQHELK